MLVIVAGMHGVAVSTMHVINVVIVPNRLVCTGLTVALVAVLRVFAVAAALALIPVGFVRAVSEAIVQVISVVLVL